MPIHRFTGIVLAVAALAAPIYAHAALRVEPAVSDLETFPHGELGFTLHIVNDGGSTYRMYPLVGELNAEDGTVTIPGTPYDANRLISADLELPRADFSVAPGQTKELSGKITVSPYLPPGTYHAVVAFTGSYIEPQTGFRLDAGTPRALFNVTVRRDIREHMNLEAFRPLRKIFITFPAGFTTVLQNGGNVALKPDMTIRFFDRKDQERGQVDFGVAGEGVAKNETATVPARWDGDAGFGRYRAQLEVHYGVANGGQFLSETAYFWVLPLWLLILLGVVLIALSYGAARVIVRSSHKHHASP